MAYEKKFKQRVLKYLEEGYTQRETAKMFGVGITAIKTWKKLLSQGHTLDNKIRKRKPKKLEPQRLREYVSANPDAYLYEIAAQFNCATSSVHEALQKLGITRKKRR